MDAIDLVAALRQEGIHDARVLRAIAEVPRDRFVLPQDRDVAWENQPLPIGFGQTISQPYVVAYMLEALALTGEERVLDVGTGSGYQAALLSRLCREVHTVEIVEPLLDLARARFAELGLTNVVARVGDGWEGWPEAAPFGGIVSASASPRIPDPLVAQLAHGARLVLPVGGPEYQVVVIVRRIADGETEVHRGLPVRFVPMTGIAQL